MFGRRRRVRELTGLALASIFESDATVPVMRPDIRGYDDVERADDLPAVYFWQKEDTGDVVLSINETRLADLVAQTVPYHDGHFAEVLAGVRSLVMESASNTLQTLLKDIPG